MLNQSLRKTAYIAVASAFGSAMLVGCVDHDYDLSKDMDLNVTLGGEELNLPVSSTATLTIKDILDLDGKDSSIKEAEQGEYGLNEGDYVLIQDGGEATKTDVNIDIVELTDLGEPKTVTQKLKVVDVAGEVRIQPEEPLHTVLDIRDNNVDPKIRSLSWATTDLAVAVTLSYNTTGTYDGTLTILGNDNAKAEFSDKWELAILDPSTKARGVTVDPDKKNVIRFNKDIPFSRNDQVTLVLNVTKIAFPSNPVEGEGLYQAGNIETGEGGKFDLAAPVSFDCDIELENHSTSFNPAEISLTTNTKVTSAELKQVCGVVKPKIDIDPTSVDITDVPDFLSEEDNHLDIVNPQIRIDVTNLSPVKASISAEIVATYPAKSNKAPETIYIGSKHNKQPIYIEPNVVNKICLNQTGANVESDYKVVQVDQLSSLLNTIPEKLEVKSIDIEATDDPVVITLDTKYHFETAYEAVVPFEFGPKMELNYNTDSDWDVEDMDKYTFGKVVLSMDVINDTPLTLDPDIYAVNDRDERNDNVKCEFSKVIAGGETTPLEVVLSADDNSLKDVSGIKIKFKASTPNTNGTTTRLNAKQNIKLDNIKVSIRGGITVDLND